MDINVNYHSSIRINNVYVDPYKIDDFVNDAKYIFITHSHYDHFSLIDIEKVVNYTELLSEKLEAEGDKSASSKLKKAILN